MDGDGNNNSVRDNPYSNFADFRSFVDVSFDSSDLCVSFGMSTENRHLVRDHRSIQGQERKLRDIKS